MLKLKMRREKRNGIMGCQFCDDCCDCTVGVAIGCSAWDDLDPSEKQDRDDIFEDWSWEDCSERDLEGYGAERDDGEDEEEHMMSTDLFCTECGAAISIKWKYCLKCGAHIEESKHCIECGKKLDFDWIYCPWCGEKVPEASERASLNNAVQLVPVVDAAIYDEDIPF